MEVLWFVRFFRCCIKPTQRPHLIQLMLRKCPNHLGYIAVVGLKLRVPMSWEYKRYLGRLLLVALLFNLERGEALGAFIPI